MMVVGHFIITYTIDPASFTFRIVPISTISPVICTYWACTSEATSTNCATPLASTAYTTILACSTCTTIPTSTTYAIIAVDTTSKVRNIIPSNTKCTSLFYWRLKILITQ
jgi:hypothetical protein